MQVVAYVLGLVASTAFFFRLQIASGFARQLSDRFDGVIEISILEHWWNVVRGAAAWPDAFYFHPYTGTLAYNDGYLLYGLPYALFRWLGADPFLGSELVNVTMRATGFAAMELFLRQCMMARWQWSILGAVVFTVSNSISLGAGHAQLLTVGFVPFFGWMTWRATRALGQGDGRRLMIWGGSASVFMGAWLMTAYYSAWFTLFFLACFAGMAALAGPRHTLAAFRRMPVRAWLSLGVVVGVFVGSAAPFLWLYLPKAEATGMHPYVNTLAYGTNKLDIVHVGDGNMLFGWADHLVQGWSRPTLPPSGEHATGQPPIILAVFACACLALWRSRHDLRDRPVLLLAATSALLWLLTLRVADFSAWRFVFDWAPGAKAVRVLVRYQIFMAVPLVATAIWHLNRIGVRRTAPYMAGLAALLVLEQVSLTPPVDLDRSAELARLRAFPRPPAACRSFFVSRARDTVSINPEIDALYSDNVDAMLLAEWFQRPTINGFSTFTPPDWDFAHAERPDYLLRVRAYAERHGLAGLCGVDLASRTWDTTPFDPAHRLQTGPPEAY